MKEIFKNIQFLKSCASLSQLPQDIGAEVAFVGRSNAGKSTALNALVGIKKLAKVSHTPGRTQLINLFELNSTQRLVDLPGYGYAAVPEDIKLRWQNTLAQYLETRISLKGLILLMDIRHPLKELDENFLGWSRERHLPVHILLTKADKLSKHAAAKTLQETLKNLAEIYPAASIQLFSSPEKIGIDQAQKQLLAWLKS